MTRSAVAPVDQPVRRFVNPYGWRDYLTLVRNNLAQKPTSRHRDLTGFLDRDAVVDPTVRPEVTVGFLGDLMPVRGRPWRLTDALADFLGASDHLVVNFEGVLWHGDGPPPRVVTAQCHPDLRVLEALVEVAPAERIVVSVANNHAADFGYEEHLRTVADIEALGHPVIGGAGPATTRLAGHVNVAAATQWTNQRHDYLSFLDDHAGLIYPEADFQLLVPHWGFELETHPRPSTIALAHDLLERWDAVVGHHPHVPCPVTTYEVGGADKLVAYSLGQASSDLKYGIYRKGMALRITLGPNASGRWGVGRASWRFLGLTPGPDEVVADLRTECRWFPELGDG